MNRIAIFEQVYGPKDWHPSALVSLYAVADLVYAEAKKELVQAFTDPENQPSQFGTVTLEMYERLTAELAEWKRAYEAKLNENGENIRKIVELDTQLTETRDLAEHWAILAEQRRGELGECKRDAEIGRLINRACRELPRHYDIEISLEKDAGTVRLFIPPVSDEEGGRMVDDFCGDGFNDHLENAIQYAIEHDAEVQEAKP